MLVVLHLAGGWYFASTLDTEALDAARRRADLEPDYDIEVRSIGEGRITLAARSGHPRRDGVWGARWPEGYALPSQVMDSAATLAGVAGGSVRETADRQEALRGAQVLYAKSWRSSASYGEPEGEARLRAGYRDWCVTEDWFTPAEKDAVFMHCLPVRRNVVVSDGVLDGPRSRVVPQAANRLHVQKSVLLEMLAP